MSNNQQGDVKLFNTLNNGDITVEEGITEMSGGLETAVYLSLFGGNEDDDGLDDNRKQWWGNLSENEPSKQYRSETQHMMRSLPLTTNRVRPLEEAILRDLRWLIPDVARTIEAEVFVIGLNKIKINVVINGDETLTFVENWLADVTCEADDSDLIVAGSGGVPPDPPPTQEAGVLPINSEQGLEVAETNIIINQAADNIEVGDISISINQAADNIDTSTVTVDVVDAGMKPIAPKVKETSTVSISIIDAGFV